MPVHPCRVLLLLIVFTATASLPGRTATDQEPAAPPTAAEVFETALEQHGLEAALAELEAALADTAETHAIDAYELGIGLPARLVVRHQRVEALELIKTLEPLFGEHPAYFQELGKAYLRCGDAEGARLALTRARDANHGRADLAWMVEHVDDLAALAVVQAALEDSLVPRDPTGLTGPYLGQTPPGDRPEVFAPGILSTTCHEYHVSFAPDGREIVFSRSGVGSLVSRLGEDGWTVPEVTYFIDENHLTEEAHYTPDGLAIVFCGRENVRNPRDLYRAERQGNGWGEPVLLFPGMYGTSTLDGTLYYTREMEGRDYGAIVKRSRTPQGYGEPVVVPGEGINTEAPDAHPWVAPDESLLIFDSYRDPGMGLYVAFRRSDRSWAPAMSIQDILGIPPVGQASLSHDGKYLFFCLAGDVYWVNADFLEGLR